MITNWNEIFDYKQFQKNHDSYLKNVTLFWKTFIHECNSKKRLVPWSGLKCRFHEREVIGSVWRWKGRQMGRLEKIFSMSENITQGKGNECCHYKSTAAMFSSSLPICPIYIFSSDSQACFAVKTSYNMHVLIVTSHNMPSNTLHTPLYPECVFMTQNMPRHDKVKINRANGQIGGKNRSTFVLTALISVCLFSISTLPHQKKIVPRRKE